MYRIASMAILLALCSCSGSADPEQKAPDQPVAGPTGAPVKSKPRSKEEVQLERRAMGRWRSAAGVLPGSRNQWLILDIAGTKDARMEVRSNDLNREAVTAFEDGHVVITYSGIDLRLPKASGPLADFKNATGTFTNTSVMRLKTANGREFDLTYDGQ